MFDNVGRNNDEEATKRSFVSLLITSLLIGAGVAFTAGVAAYEVVEAMAPVEPPPLVFADLDEPETIAKPDLPPLPPPPAGVASETKTEDLPERMPDDMDPDQKELEKPETKIVDSTPIPGVADGDPNGVPGGKPGGIPGGDLNGCVGCTGDAGGIISLHRSEVRIKRRAQLDYPEAAAQQGLGEQRCIAKISIDEKGVPFDVKVEACPKVFHAATREGLLKWRWYPAKRNKVKVKAALRISVVFKN